MATFRKQLYHQDGRWIEDWPDKNRGQDSFYTRGPNMDVNSSLAMGVNASRVKVELFSRVGQIFPGGSYFDI